MSETIAKIRNSLAINLRYNLLQLGYDVGTVTYGFQPDDLDGTLLVIMNLREEYDALVELGDTEFQGYPIRYCLSEPNKGGVGRDLLIEKAKALAGKLREVGATEQS